MSILYILNNKEIIDLFEIKLSDFEGYFRFHGSKNLNKNIIFKGNEYLYIPCEISNLEYNSDGKQSRPIFSVSNLNNYFTNLIKDRNNLIGRRIYRKKIFARDLDIENFNSEDDFTRNPLGSASFKDFVHVDTFVINKKNSENKEKIEFTLSNILDIDGLTAPRRKIYSDFCNWQYRGHGCNYGKLQNYDGPIITEPNLSNVSNLAEIAATYGISNNLVIWLKPDGIVAGDETRRDTFFKKYSPEYAGPEFDQDVNIPDGIETYQQLQDVFSSNNISTAFGYAWVYRDGQWYSSPNISESPVRRDVVTVFSDSELFYEAEDVTDWTNEAADINTSLTPSGVVLSSTNASNQTYSPQKYINNNNRMNGNAGVFFSANKDYFGFGEFGNASMEIDYDFNGSPHTIIYVGENVDRLFNYSRPSISYDGEVVTWFRGKAGTVLTSSSENWSLGYRFIENVTAPNFGKVRESYIDSATFLDEFSSQSNTSAYDNLNTPTAYSCILGDYTLNESVRFVKDGVSLKNTNPTSNTSPSQKIGINQRTNNNHTLDQSTECVIYEVIIFNTNISETALSDIHVYLAEKYNLPINYARITTTERKSVDYFKEIGEQANLGVPVATENNKLFSISQSFLDNRFESFRVPRMRYRGTYSSKEYYKFGDFVKIDPEINFDFNETFIKKNSEIPARFFVCVNRNGAHDLHPFKFKNVWIEDKCSKTLNGCLLRFGSNNGSSQIPFGGFPGTVTYEYKMPGAGQ